jgi:hypothetical protein
MPKKDYLYSQVKIKFVYNKINLGKGDEVIVLLLFYNENKELIGKDRVVLGDEKVA